ncbi:16S rRNA (guanine(966)-N(2))-methyltransferase RsmD [Thalassotalea euphylliae]|uniref:Ribosomal RNA small subunit methyltransferase D n=1 Tax=Thalassotalea euphylliae TaxID=1655234 RepID=A0A3E0UKQ1_9GAMM|nr:16S rRNA (guanine(966)-N(2))-methyltransferase RsmD [Thalassotalea euphylliae]REL37203.1 16S rRNA (guanine(966)-N(2))-methyltransferase RsmD [Thalassotalea euphylliae]
MNKARARKRSTTSSTAKSQKSTSSIRIIAGQHRGRKLPVLSSDGLRPTTDRVKETLFNWLMTDIQGSNCLDCFAGAGSLGFEAQSRGAETVTMLELNDAAAKQLKANQSLLNATNLEVVNTNTLGFLTKPTNQFDIVFIDPPFRQQLAQQTIDLLTSGWLSENALVYVETESDSPTPSVPANWQLAKEKTAGQVTYRLYQLV